MVINITVLLALPCCVCLSTSLFYSLYPCCVCLSTSLFYSLYPCCVCLSTSLFYSLYKCCVCWVCVFFYNCTTTTTTTTVMTLDYDCLSLGTLAPSAGQRTIGQSYRDTSVIEI